MAGTHLACPVGGADPELRGIRVDLDRDPPGRTWFDPRGGGEPVTPPFSVRADEEERFYIEAWTQKCDCRWTAALELSLGDRTMTERIGDPSRPFRTSSSSGSRTVEWRDGRWQPLAR